MNQLETSLGEQYIVGLSEITKNSEEMSGAGKIPGLWGRFLTERWIDRIPDLVVPGNIAVLYTDLESDETGSYRIVLGGLVSKPLAQNSVNTNRPGGKSTVYGGAKIPDGLIFRTVPAQKYVKFTTPVGPLSRITMEAWAEIWADTNLKARRTYSGDFEIYDSRASDPENASFDILIAVR